MPLLFSSTIDLINREMAKIDRVFKPQIRDLDKNLLGADLNMSYAGFSPGDPWTIPLDRYKTIINAPSPDVISLGPDIIIHDYTKKPRERTKNLYSFKSGTFSLAHIPNLVNKFIEDNNQIFSTRDEEFYQSESRQWEKTSKNVRDRFVDMFGADDLRGISEDDPVKVLSLDLRKRLWESWRAGNNQISDIYRIVRQYDGFDLILPEMVKPESSENPKYAFLESSPRSGTPETIDEDNFNWETGKYE